MCLIKFFECLLIKYFLQNFMSIEKTVFFNWFRVGDLEYVLEKMGVQVD